MVKKLYTESYIEDIADAIREKNGSSNTYTTAQMGPAIRAIPTGGGSAEVVNGVIEYFKAKSGTISANTFVEFVNDISGGLSLGEETQLFASNQSQLSAVALDDSTVFIAFKSGSYLRGVVCTISGTTITAGTDTQLSTISMYSYGPVSAVALDDSTVFVAHRVGTTAASATLYGVVCTISGTTITAGTDTQISTGAGSYSAASAVALDDSTVFVAHRNNDGTNNTLYGVVCTISGTTITAGTDTQLSTNSISTSQSYVSAVALDTSTVFVAYANAANSYHYGLICTISGTTITAGTDTQLSARSGSHYAVSAAALSTSAIFVSYRVGSYFYGIIAQGSTTIRESITKIEGLTRTQATTTTAGDVWVLNV